MSRCSSLKIVLIHADIRLTHYVNLITHNLVIVVLITVPRPKHVRAILHLYKKHTLIMVKVLQKSIHLHYFKHSVPQALAWQLHNQGYIAQQQ